jgi:hypothetical protein
MRHPADDRGGPGEGPDQLIVDEPLPSALLSALHSIALKPSLSFDDKE